MEAGRHTTSLLLEAIRAEVMVTVSAGAAVLIGMPRVIARQRAAKCRLAAAVADGYVDAGHDRIGEGTPRVLSTAQAIEHGNADPPPCHSASF